MPQTPWQLDQVHSTIGFSVRHMMVTKTRGQFTKWNGTLEFDETRPEAARITAQIDVASIDTHEPQRDGHLRSPDFFDAERFPQITFRSTRIERAGDGRFRITGELTIRGVTRPIVLDAEYAGRVTDPQGGVRAGFSLSATIDRRDFGLAWNMVLEAGGFVVGDKVEITIEVEAVQPKAAAVAAAVETAAAQAVA